MNYIDLFVLVLLVYAIFKGFTKGFILQMTVIAALGLGIYAALKLSDLTALKLKGHVSLSPESLHLLAMGLTFALVFFLVWLLGKLVEKMVEAMDLSMLNRLFGVVFSAAKILLICGLILAFVDRIDQKIAFLPKNTREKSIFYEPLTKMIITVFPSMHTPGTNYEGVKVQV
ncbi:MAG TPA: CvpA family protein [Bacteroidales bacterium]|nr:CvpA family protein [Bacteroidales bacterium]